MRPKGQTKQKVSTTCALGNIAKCVRTSRIQTEACKVISRIDGGQKQLSTWQHFILVCILVTRHLEYVHVFSTVYNLSLEK